MFDTSIVFISVDFDFPPNFLSLLFTFPLLYVVTKYFDTKSSERSKQ